MFAAAAALCVAGAAQPASAACQLSKLFEVPVVMRGLSPTVDAKINGHDVTLSVGTGGFFSSVTAATVARTGMARSTVPFGMRISGMGGREADAQAARAAEFNLSGAGFKNMDFVVFGGGGDGQLGQNILGAFDVEFDFANGVMRFFQAKDCRDANLAYWSSGKTVSRLSLDSDGKYLSDVRAHAKIDGREVRVKFTSGSGVSYLSRQAAARVGVKPGSEGVTSGGMIVGAFGKAIDTSIATFQSFAVGDEEIKNARLRLADIDMTETDMMLGTDFFLSHRIMISSSQRRLYFTYNGGPVFQLEGEGQAQARLAPAVPAGSAAPAGSGGPLTTAELDSQGAALAARRDFPAAIGAYAAAIEKDPNDAAAYRGRGLARLQNRQPVLGLADLETALRLKPKDYETLLLRGRVYLQQKELARADADFDAAQAAAPENREVVVQIGNAYLNAGQYEKSVRVLDRWVTAHPKVTDATMILTERCNARAIWGHELDQALAACDAAVRSGGKAAEALENRGVVLLRMGRLDEALKQFDAALAAQPKDAWALYGRGVARAKKGDKPGADADFAAAIAIRPNIAAEARRYGLGQDGAVTGAVS